MALEVDGVVEHSSSYRRHFGWLLEFYGPIQRFNEHSFLFLQNRIRERVGVTQERKSSRQAAGIERREDASPNGTQRKTVAYVEVRVDSNN